MRPVSLAAGGASLILHLGLVALWLGRPHPVTPLAGTNVTISIEGPPVGDPSQPPAMAAMASAKSPEPPATLAEPVAASPFSGPAVPPGPAGPSLQPAAPPPSEAIQPPLQAADAVRPEAPASTALPLRPEDHSPEGLPALDEPRHAALLASPPEASGAALPESLARDGGAAQSEPASASVEALRPSPQAALSESLPPGEPTSPDASAPEGHPAPPLLALDEPRPVAALIPREAATAPVGAAPPASVAGAPLAEAASTLSPIVAPQASARLAEGAGPAAMPEAPAVHAVADMAGFVARYDGGRCFFVSPRRITGASAVVEGFSDSRERLDAFDAAFLAETGLESTVDGRRVWKPQCPVLDFLNAARSGGGAAPDIEIDRDRLRDGAVLSGRVRGLGAAHLTLLLVSEKGFVSDVTGQVGERGDAQAFSLRLRHDRAEGAPFPQLLVAIASADPLPVASLPASTRDGGFQLLADRASQASQRLRAVAKFFLVDQ